MSEEISAAQSEIKSLKRLGNEQQSEIRYLKSVLETHLYPELANELLRREGMPTDPSANVSNAVIDAMADADAPLPFIAATELDNILLSREQQLFEKMKSQIAEGDKNEKSSGNRRR